MGAKRKFSSRTILKWLECRSDGYTCESIAIPYDTTKAYVRAATNRVVADDAKLHGDRIVFPQHFPAPRGSKAK